MLRGRAVEVEAAAGGGQAVMGTGIGGGQFHSPPKRFAGIAVAALPEKGVAEMEEPDGSAPVGPHYRREHPHCVLDTVKFEQTAPQMPLDVWQIGVEGRGPEKRFGRFRVTPLLHRIQPQPVPAFRGVGMTGQMLAPHPLGVGQVARLRVRSGQDGDRLGQIAVPGDKPLPKCQSFCLESWKRLGHGCSGSRERWRECVWRRNRNSPRGPGRGRTGPSREGKRRRQQECGGNYQQACSPADGEALYSPRERRLTARGG